MSQGTQSDLTLHIDETIYDRTTVLRACYWFTDRCYVFVTRPSPAKLDVRLTPKDVFADLTAIAGEFQNSLLEYELRRIIEHETGKIRELLVAKAVAATGTLDDPPPGSATDAVDERKARLER